jgi:flagellar biosynthesis/type III secretory pathway M-ring protein FliF/YscJ
MPEWLKSPVIGALLGGIFVFLVFLLTFFLYYRPALAKLDEQLSQKQQEVVATEERLRARSVPFFSR